MNKQTAELLRYIVNGVAATAVHYGILTFNLKILAFPSAGIANLVAAVFGITASFLGSRYFVFRRLEVPILLQASKFGTLYAAIALIHGSVLFVWSDWLAFSYKIGFLLATAIQFSLSYIGNKILVFKT